MHILLHHDQTEKCVGMKRLSVNNMKHKRTYNKTLFENRSKFVFSHSCVKSYEKKLSLNLACCIRRLDVWPLVPHSTPAADNKESHLIQRHDPLTVNTRTVLSG